MKRILVLLILLVAAPAIALAADHPRVFVQSQPASVFDRAPQSLGQIPVADTVLDIETESGTNTVRHAPHPTTFALVAEWEIEIVRQGKVIETWSQSNLCVTEGLAAMMGVMFGSWSQTSPWYVVPFDNDITTTITDDYESHNYSECTAYANSLDNGLREVWDGVATAATSWSNSADRATFTIDLPDGGSTTFYGAAVVAGSGVSGDDTSGNTLFSVAEFGTSRNLVDNDVIYITVTYTIAPSN